MQTEIVLTKVDQLEWQTLAGGIKYKFIATGDKFLTGIGVAQPGCGETRHKHTDQVEESYYVIKGQGKISWKSGKEEHSLEFSAGDALYLPYGVENEFVNTGNDELWIVFNITKAEKSRE